MTGSRNRVLTSKHFPVAFGVNVYQKGVTLALSLRETEIAYYVQKGLTDREIGAILRLSLNTIRVYKTMALSKLGLRNRVELAVWANTRLQEIKDFIGVK